MTDSTENDQTSAESSEGPKKRSDIDVLLFLLAHFVEQGELDAAGHGNSIGVTLVTTGGILSGTLIGRAEYVQSLTATARTGSEWMGEFLSGALEELPDREDEPITHVHLRSARLVAGDSVSQAFSETRVRINDVVAWSLGAFSTTDA